MGASLLRGRTMSTNGGRFLRRRWTSTAQTAAERTGGMRLPHSRRAAAIQPAVVPTLSRAPNHSLRTGAVNQLHAFNNVTPESALRCCVRGYSSRTQHGRQRTATIGGSSTWAGVALAAAAVVAGIARGVLCGLGMGHGVWNLYAMHYACIAGATPLTGSNYADRRRYSPEVCCVAWDTAFAVSMLQCIILCVHSGRDVSYCSRKLQTVARRCVWS